MLTLSSRVMYVGRATPASHSTSVNWPLQWPYPCPPLKEHSNAC